MSTQPPHLSEIPPAAPLDALPPSVAPESPGGCGPWGWILGGCLAVCLLMLISCAGLGWYAYRQLPSMAGKMARQAVDQLDIPVQDKQALREQIDRVTNEYKAGRLTLEQVGEIFEKLSQSPLFGLVMAQASYEKYVVPSGLSDDEKAQAKRTLDRTARGVYEKTIAWADLDAALDHISDRDANGQRQFREQVSDEELREFLAACKTLADEHQIPDEPFQVDFAAEVRKAVDEVLQPRVEKEE